MSNINIPKNNKQTIKIKKIPLKIRFNISHTQNLADFSMFLTISEYRLNWRMSRLY